MRSETNLSCGMRRRRVRCLWADGAARFPDRLTRSCGASASRASGNDLERSAH
jgi:hypothetical protein